MKLSFKLLATLVGCLLLGSPTQAAEPERLEINATVDASKLIPITLTGFSGEALTVLRFDLEVAGFQIVTAETAKYEVSGSNNGSILGKVVEKATKSGLLANEYTGGNTRTQAHAFADDIVQKITGKPGIARTRIAFKGEQAKATELYVCDYDGANLFPLTRDNTIVAAPCWVPGRRVIYYTSYKSGYPDIYAQDLNSGERKVVAKYPGLNTSASISPNGRSMAMILSKGGSPDLYVADLDGSNLRQLTKSREDESSPCWSPDGKTLCFVSRTSGRAALYTIPMEGGTPRSLKTPGAGTVTEPDWSPDGKWIVFTVLRGNFEICMVPAQGGEVTDLVSGEDPSWAPNSRTIVFTRRVKGKRVLSLLDVPTKRVKDVSLTLGSCSQPSWAR